MSITPSEALVRCIEHREIFQDEMLSLWRRLMSGELTPVQKSFIQYGGFQCGICTPGQVVAATALLKENPKPNEDEIKDWMMGNLCRCTGYYKIIESIQKAHQFAK